MKKLILFCLILSSSTVFSQEEEPPNKIYKHSKSYITFDFFSLFSPNTARYRIGYIQRLNEKWAVGMDLGYANEDIIFIDRDYISDYSFFEIRPEVYYVLNVGRKVQQYLSVEAFYLNNKATFLRGTYEPEGPEELIRYDSADYNRNKFGAHIKYGAFINFSKHIGFNPYAGIGFRTKDLKFSNVINPTAAFFPTDGFGFSLNNREGTFSGLSLDLGAKFQYRLN